MLEMIDIKGKIILLSGLHIGGSDNNIELGNISSVIKHIHTNEPYIPGSSIKGKIRSLLEQVYGFSDIFEGNTTNCKNLNIEERKKKLLIENDVNKLLKSDELQKDIGLDKKEIVKLAKIFKLPNEKIEKLKMICKLFGDTSNKNPTRGIFRDSLLNNEYKKLYDGDVIEIKTENSVNNMTMKATPRTKERVIEGAEFDFTITLKIMEKNEKNDLLDLLFEGLTLLEKDYLGGHGSRGSGRIKIEFDKDLEVLKQNNETN